MTRQEEIEKIAGAFAIDEVKDTCTCNPASKRGLLYVGFVDGARWADEHPNWISVEDELPELYDTYLVATDGNVVEMSLYDIDGWHNWSGGKTTHWMPLPAPPKKGQ